MQDAVSKLKEALGDRVVTDEAALKRYSRDFWPLLMMRDELGKEIQMPLALVMPGSVDDIKAVLRIARESGSTVVVRGGGSSVTGASAGGGSIVMDISNLNRVLDINEYDLTITVESGARLSDVERRLNELGYSLRHIPQSFNYATIGGLIATLSSGQYSTLYGNVEDAVINMEVVLPNGEVTWLRRNNAPRSSTGPPLKFLFTGSEGMLGVVTKAVLRIVPLPPFEKHGSFKFGSFDDGVKALRDLMVKGIIPAVARLYDDRDSMIRFNEDRPLLIISFEGHYEDLVGDLWGRARSVIEEHGGEYAGAGHFEEWLRTRFNVEDDMEKARRFGLWFDTIEVAATWSRLARLHEDMENSLMGIDGVAAVMAHASHLYLNGACIYFTVLFKPDEAIYGKVWDAAMSVAARDGATISHHHGIGMLRSRSMGEELGGAISIIKSIKDALDPWGILNSRRGMFFPD